MWLYMSVVGAILEAPEMFYMQRWVNAEILLCQGEKLLGQFQFASSKNSFGMLSQYFELRELQ